MPGLFPQPNLPSCIFHLASSPNSHFVLHDSSFLQTDFRALLLPLFINYFSATAAWPPTVYLPGERKHHPHWNLSEYESSFPLTAVPLHSESHTHLSSPLAWYNNQTIPTSLYTSSVYKRWRSTLLSSADTSRTGGIVPAPRRQIPPHLVFPLSFGHVVHTLGPRSASRLPSLDRM